MLGSRVLCSAIVCSAVVALAYPCGAQAPDQGEISSPAVPVPVGPGDFDLPAYAGIIPTAPQFIPPLALASTPLGAFQRRFLNHPVLAILAGRYTTVNNPADYVAAPGTGTDGVVAILITISPTVTHLCTGNRDNKVDLNDQGNLQANFGRTNATYAEGDATGDGVVNLNDFSVMKANFGLDWRLWPRP